ncbi:MAG: hypothetical protein VYB50_03800 [Candidatus Thermoplasmatota archaeon]|nr:hypothetical protein [Candidatus Thermoplasmatota archaeon]
MPSEKALSSRISRLERQLDRLRSSPSLRLGAHITTAMRKPWRAPFLPITLPWQMLMIGLEMLGRRPVPVIEQHQAAEEIVIDETSSPTLMDRAEPNNTILMFPTNGVGFGHFTRMLALAKRLKLADPELEVIFFTTMPTLHLLKAHNIPAHFISGPKYFRNFESSDWNALVEEELTLCLETHKPKMFVFDGAFPYRGMLRSIRHQPNMSKVWMRRGTFRKGSTIPVDSISHFDLIIHPQDSVPLSPSEIDHDVEVLTCPPIVLLDETELVEPDMARRRLGVPLDSRVVYVQLGAGEINDIDSEIRLTIEALISHNDVHVVLGESMIGERLEIDFDRVHLIRDYPNSMYFKGFDATVMAGGYNSFHEARTFGLTSLFYPNMNTGMDDQLARCNVASVEGWGNVLVKRNADTIPSAIDELLSRIDNNPINRDEKGAEKLATDLLHYDFNFRNPTGTEPVPSGNPI